MVKDQKVKCVRSNDRNITDGKIYAILAGVGDVDHVNGGTVRDDSFIICSDAGDDIYCIYPRCLFGQWQLVE